MDVLRKELTAIYVRQSLKAETLDENDVEKAIDIVGSMISINNSCSIITDAAKDRSFIIMGTLGNYLGISSAYHNLQEISSSDEDAIYNRLHPENLVDKRMLEYEFFKFIDKKPTDKKLRYKATCRLRLKNADNEYVFVDNSTQLLRLSPAGKIWLILCCYDYSPNQSPQPRINGKIINNETGEIIHTSFTENRNSILSAREKEILRQIKDGLLSKEIANVLNISINTVNRHRQNILQKLSVNNSFEAVNAALDMNLL